MCIVAKSEKSNVLGYLSKMAFQTFNILVTDTLYTL